MDWRSWIVRCLFPRRTVILCVMDDDMNGVNVQIIAYVEHPRETRGIIHTVRMALGEISDHIYGTSWEEPENEQSEA